MASSVPALTSVQTVRTSASVGPSDSGAGSATRSHSVRRTSGKTIRLPSVDAIALPNTTGNEIMKARGAGKFDAKFAFSVQPNSMAVRRDAFELRQYLNTTISYVKLNGELDAIAQKWTGKALPALQAF